MQGEVLPATINMAHYKFKDQSFSISFDMAKNLNVTTRLCNLQGFTPCPTYATVLLILNLLLSKAIILFCH